MQASIFTCIKDKIDFEYVRKLVLETMDKDKLEIINNLICEVRVGNNESLSKLYDIMFSTIWYIALKYLKKQQDAQDVVQEFWKDIYRITSSFRIKKNGFSFLCKVMTNKTINAYKKIHKREKVEINYVDYFANDRYYEDKNIENIPTNIMVSNALNYLPEIQRIIIQEIYFEQKTLREIAKDLHIPTTKVFEEKTKAIKKLKEIFEKFKQN